MTFHVTGGGVRFIPSPSYPSSSVPCSDVRLACTEIAEQLERAFTSATRVEGALGMELVESIHSAMIKVATLAR